MSLEDIQKEFIENEETYTDGHLDDNSAWKRIATIMKVCNRNEVMESPNIYIGKSKIGGGGDGVFAKRDMGRGTLLCYYPCHIMFCDDNTAICRDLEYYKDITNEQIEETLLKICKDYHMRVPVGKSDAHVFGDPRYKNNLNVCGHIFNDKGFHPRKRYKPELNKCVFNGMEIRLSVDCKKGEELGLEYGSPYWFLKDESQTHSRRHQILNKLKK